MTIFNSLSQHFQRAPLWATLLFLAVPAYSQVATPPSAGATGNTGARSASGPVKVRAFGISPAAGLFASKMGTRLTVTGKEQTTLRGSLSVAAGAASPIDVIWQNPGLLRVTISGSESRVLSFDGATPAASDRTLSATDSDLLEMLTDDYPDAFFVSLARGRAGFRFLGGRFRADTGATKDYAGPYYTIYQKAGLVPSRKAAAQKFYLFDSATGLLSKVRYVRTDGKTTVPVEVRYSNWQTADGEQFPGSIVRVSQGKPEITLNFSSFSIAPAAETSVFKQQ